MCGIAGWIAPSRNAPDERALQPMLSSLAHRGPDGAGSAAFVAGRGEYRVVLGHRPLAIIHPVGAHQPMCDAAAGLALTFNGGIYIHESTGALYFASEMKALLKLPQVPRDVDLSGVWDYLAYRYVPGPRTLFGGIRKLPPATAAIWHRGTLQELRYWTPPDKFPRGRTKSLSKAQTLDAFLGHLSEAVQLQMVS